MGRIGSEVRVSASLQAIPRLILSTAAKKGLQPRGFVREGRWPFVGVWNFFPSDFPRITVTVQIPVLGLHSTSSRVVTSARPVAPVLRPSLSPMHYPCGLESLHYRLSYYQERGGDC